MKKDNMGFTLAELLIVVAIIAVLVAIAIPIFNTQMEKSREATDLANIRSAYIDLMNKYMENGQSNSVTVPVRQKQAEWQNSAGYLEVYFEGSITQAPIPGKNSGEYTLNINSAGGVTVF